MAQQQATRLDPEKVAYWYFRLNGFFQMQSFIVHPTGKGGQRTDADLIGVRFPHRAERYFDDSDGVMGDDTDALRLASDIIDIAIVEVKTNQACSLNGPWSNPDARNIHRVLAAIGCFPMDQVEEAAACLYGKGEFWAADAGMRVRLIALGRERSNELAGQYPNIAQVTWDGVLAFIGDRLHTFRTNKKDVSQWDDQIMLLQELVRECSEHGSFDQDAFIGAAGARMGLQPAA